MEFLARWHQLSGKPIPDYLRRVFTVEPPAVGARLDFAWQPKVQHEYQKHEHDGYGRETFILDDRYELVTDMSPLSDATGDSFSIKDRQSGEYVYLGAPQGEWPYFGLHRGLAALALYRAGGNPKDIKVCHSASYQISLLREDAYGREGAKEAARQERRLKEMQETFTLAYGVNPESLMKSTLALSSWIESVEIGQEREAPVRPSLSDFVASASAPGDPDVGLEI